jgi:hypothetical protein
MAKRKVATRSDRRRAPSASASGASRAKTLARMEKPGPAGRDRPRGDDLAKAGPRPAAPPARRPPGARKPSEEVPSPAVPSSLNLNRRPSAARSGRAELEERYREHHETGPGMTAGDVDADWEAAYSVGDEAPGGDNPTPGQTVVEDVGRALGVEYQDGEELKGADKIENRDRHRWELDPASSEDYTERTRGGGKRRRQSTVESRESTVSQESKSRKPSVS